MLTLLIMTPTFSCANSESGMIRSSRAAVLLAGALLIGVASPDPMYKNGHVPASPFPPASPGSSPPPCPFIPGRFSTPVTGDHIYALRPLARRPLRASSADEPHGTLVVLLDRTVPLDAAYWLEQARWLRMGSNEARSGEAALPHAAARRGALAFSLSPWLLRRTIC
jgi:hypothetical protein